MHSESSRLRPYAARPLELLPCGRAQSNEGAQHTGCILACRHGGMFGLGWGAYICVGAALVGAPLFLLVLRCGRDTPITGARRIRSLVI